MTHSERSARVMPSVQLLAQAQPSGARAPRRGLARPVATDQSEARAAEAQSGLFHVSARLQPALEAAEIAHVGITHVLERLADER
jgi:hypothetical protein